MRKSPLILFLLFIILNIQAQDRDKLVKSYVNVFADEAVNEMLQYKIPASITLAQGLFESGFGRSRLATEANNHFGIKCHKGWNGERTYHDDDEKGECFRKYKTAQESYRDHSLFLKTRDRYSALFTLKLKDYKGWAKGLKKAGYATNPKYPIRLITIIEEFELYHFDTLTSLNALEQMHFPLNDEQIAKVDTVKEKSKDTLSIKKNIPKNDSEFIVLSDRPIQYQNRIKYIIVQKDDTRESIALKYDLLSVRTVDKYNDLHPNQELQEGMRIYLQPKRKKCPEKEHAIIKDQSLWEVSQLYGLRLQKLAEYNSLKVDDKINPGMLLKLRK